MSLSDTSPHAELGKLESRCPSPASPAPDRSSSTCTASSSLSLFSKSSFPRIYFSRIWLVSWDKPAGPQKRPQQKPRLQEPAEHQGGSSDHRHFEEHLRCSSCGSRHRALILGQELMHGEAVYGTGVSAQPAPTPKLCLATSPQDQARVSAPS